MKLGKFALVALLFTLIQAPNSFAKSGGAWDHEGGTANVSIDLVMDVAQVSTRISPEGELICDTGYISDAIKQNSGNDQAGFMKSLEASGKLLSSSEQACLKQGMDVVTAKAK